MNGYNFTERVRKVLAMAREEAARLHHEYVGTEHILLGLIREGEGVAAAVLQNLSVDLDEIQQKIEDTVKKGKASQTTGPDLPYTSRAKKVLELAMSEARELSHSYVGTEHLLLGLIREGEGVAAEVLAGFGADHARLREQVLRLLTGGSEEAAAGTRLVRMTVPVDLVDAAEQLAEVRRQKEAAVEAGDFDTGAALRDREKQLLADKLRREREWMAGVDVQAVLEENQRVHGELERLRKLLRQHGIEPNGGTPRTA
jgi:ATP-dependent Clp protease ATP-binding subunit ClpA